MKNLHKERNKISHTIGLLIDWVDAPCQNEILSGLNSFSEENGLNLICFSLGRLESPHEWERNRNIILDFVSRERIDGLIVVSVIANLTGITRAEELLSGYSGYPMVSICEKFFDKPAVLIDNNEGMRKIMDHIINVHGYRKIAFLKGPQGNMEAQKRFRVYQDMLRLHKIPFREEFVIEGDFEVGSGSEAARTLMKNGQDIDVIVSANDLMAMGFLEEIRFRNNGVKFKIPITGFDDTFGGIGTHLTSVRQPFYDMARKAGSLLIDILEDRPVPPETLIEPELKVRQSCGCVLFENSIKAFSLPLSLADTLMKLMPDCDKAVLESIMRLDDSFRSEFPAKNEKDFLACLNEIIDSFLDCKKNRFSVLSRAFSIFREFIVGSLIDREELSAAEELFYKAQNIITDALDHFGLMSRMEKDQSFQKINDIGAAISTTLEIDKKMDILFKELPPIGFSFC
ncbi:MAG: substrate-binding domain-containing protein, partial [Brevinematales bacterium]